MSDASRSTDLAPVAVYTYTRFDHFVSTINALRSNYLASESVLYVVSDGPKIPEHAPFVQAIRNFTDDLTGFREVVKIYRDKNLGMAQSPPMAERQIIGDHGLIINMEDDNITSRNFLDFLNGALAHFYHDGNVFSVSGYCPKISFTAERDNSDFFRYPWNMAWGYGLWKHKYNKILPLVNRYNEHVISGLLKRQNRAGGLYVTDSLRRDFYKQKHFPDGIICTEMFRLGMQSIVPTRSKVQNIGLDGSGQSSQKITDKYDVELDSTGKRKFDFEAESSRSDLYRRELSQVFNGSKLTQFLRYFGIYHEASAIRNKLGRLV